jgi:hypothetical protein
MTKKIDMESSGQGSQSVRGEHHLLLGAEEIAFADSQFSIGGSTCSVFHRLKAYLFVLTR